MQSRSIEGAVMTWTREKALAHAKTYGIDSIEDEIKEGVRDRFNRKITVQEETVLRAVLGLLKVERDAADAKRRDEEINIGKDNVELARRTADATEASANSAHRSAEAAESSARTGERAVAAAEKSAQAAEGATVAGRRSAYASELSATVALRTESHARESARWAKWAALGTAGSFVMAAIALVVSLTKD